MFEWDQTLEEVNVYLDLPPNVPKKLFYCKIQSQHIEVGIRGNPPYLNVRPRPALTPPFPLRLIFVLFIGVGLIIYQCLFLCFLI